jgi:hypothetical protein
MLLAWRADRRAEREQAFKFRQSDPRAEGRVMAKRPFDRRSA